MTRKTKQSLKLKKSRKNLIEITIFFIIVFTFGFLTSSFIFKSTKKVTDNTSKNLSSNNNDKNNFKNNGQASKDTEHNKENIYTDVLLSAVGDCTLGRDDKYSYTNSLPHILKQKGNDYSYIFKNVYSIFKNDDITIANFEGTLTDSTSKANKKFTFKAPGEYAKILTAGSIECVNISNNHTMDYLLKGFEDTKENLKNEGIKFFGEGNVWKTEIKGIKFGFLGYKGFNNTKELFNKIETDIKILKSENRIVVINFHWGQEGSHKPNESQKELAHHAIDNGADLIIGHHPHVLQGVENYKNKLIFYSLGNFAFGGNKNPSDKDTMIVQIKFKLKNKSLNSYDFRIIPCSISSVNYMNDYCPIPAEDNLKTKILNKIKRISNNLEIDDTFRNISVE